MLLILASGAIMKSAPVTTRDYNLQADLVVMTLIETQNDIFELGQIASLYDDREWVASQCDYALTLLSEVLRLLELPDPRFEYDDLPFLSSELNLEDAAHEMASVGTTNPWDPDDAQSTAEPESIGHTIY